MWLNPKRSPILNEQYLLVWIFGIAGLCRDLNPNHLAHNTISSIISLFFSVFFSLFLFSECVRTLGGGGGELMLF
jgi:hypothetical protein